MANLARTTHSTALLTLGVLLAAPAAAQDGVLPPGVQDLPIGWSPAELAGDAELGVGHLRTAPPNGTPRAAAEWEENVGVFCLWSNSDLMREIQNYTDLYIITTNSAWWNSWLAGQGIPTTNVNYLNAATDSFWVRDYGPWFLWDGNDDFGICDTIYNRPRPKDDLIPQKVGQAYAIPVYGPDLIHTGGNYYTDGFGNGWSTTLPYKENPTKTQAQVDDLMEQYLGIDRYVTRNIPADIQHFDTFGKLLAPDSLLWGQFPEGSSPWLYHEAALKYYQTLQSPYGWPYKITRMPLFNQGSSWTAYINSLQSGPKILMPEYNTGNDSVAKALFQQAAPGYDVVLVDDGGTYWGDSIHCRSRNFINGETIRIYSQPHWERADISAPSYPVSAEVIPANSTSLVGTPTIYYTTTGGAPYSSIAMVATGTPNVYQGAIPGQASGALIRYYIEASDGAGRTKTDPPVAPSGTFKIRVQPDTAKPTIGHEVVGGVLPSEWPFEVSCTAIDNCGIPVVTLEYAINGVPQPTVTMVQEAGTFRFTGTLTGSISLGDMITYRIVATDAATPANVGTTPTTGGWNWVPVEDVPSIVVVELDETADSGQAWLDVCDDLGLKTRFETSWPADLSSYDVALINLGVNPVDVKLTTGQANAVVSFLNGGGSAYMEGGDAWYGTSPGSIYRSYFGIASAASGADITANVLGVSGQPTQGMSFGYYGEGDKCDHLTPTGAAQSSLTCSGQVKALTYSTGTYRSVASAIELGNLLESSSPSHVKLLAGLYLDHLGLDLDLLVHSADNDPLRHTASLEGDPAALYYLLGAFGPGYLPLGGMGTLKIDYSTLFPVTAGLVAGSGEVDTDILIPNKPGLAGLEVYLQALVENTGSGQFELTNRDRLTVSLP